MIKWEKMRVREAEKIAEDFQKNHDDQRDPLINWDISDLSEDYQVLGSKMNSFVKGWNDLDSYDFDFEFGIYIYKMFVNEYGMTESQAADDDIWRYIQMKVVPNVILRRWDFLDGKLRVKRFYLASQRIYLKELWWYIHILWDTNEEVTRKYKSNVDISQIIDRVGTDGTRVDVYKAIMHLYSQIPRKSSNDIKRIMTLNSAYCTIIEPELSESTLDEYAM